jgi:hypothetical protein
MTYSKLFLGTLVLLVGGCSNEAPTYNPGTAGATAGTSGGGSGGTGGVATGTAIAGALDGYLYLVPCNGGAASGYDCANNGCVAGSVTQTMQFPIGGMPGQVYDMTFHVRGVVEGYRYDGGTRDNGTTMQMQTTTGNDLFHRGGMQLATGASGSDYNTMQLDVTPAVTGETNRYFLNSIPVPLTDASAAHLTFIIDYEKTIKITGGGMLTFSSFDSNCRLVMNCATSSTNQCADHWTVPGVAGAMPAPAATFMQPYTNGAGQFGQWVYVDVTAIVPAS